MRLCLEPGCLELVAKGRCSDHARVHDAPRNAAKAKRYRSGGWEQLSKRMRDEHVAVFGWVCPGWRRSPHSSTDLVVDHDDGVMCRSCNGSKAALLDKPAHALG